MFFELSLKGKKELFIIHCARGAFFGTLFKADLWCGGGALPRPPTHTGSGEAKFFQVLPRALDTAASLPCWEK